MPNTGKQTNNTNNVESIIPLPHVVLIFSFDKCVTKK